MQVTATEAAMSILKKGHAARLDALNELNKTTLRAGLDYLAATLAARRDEIILTDRREPANNMRLVTIAAAIEEYAGYSNCENKYFYPDGDSIKARDGTFDEALAKYVDERQRHLSAFCDIVKKNIFIWEADDDQFLQDNPS